MSWYDSAACKGRPTEWWFDDEDSAAWAMARSICSCCEVRQECLDASIDNWEEAGMWGGKSPKQRRKIARATGRAPRRIYLLRCVVCRAHFETRVATRRTCSNRCQMRLAAGAGAVGSGLTDGGVELSWTIGKRFKGIPTQGLEIGLYGDGDR